MGGQGSGTVTITCVGQVVIPTNAAIAPRGRRSRGRALASSAERRRGV